MIDVLRLRYLCFLFLAVAYPCFSSAPLAEVQVKPFHQALKERANVITETGVNDGGALSSAINEINKTSIGQNLFKLLQVLTEKVGASIVIKHDNYETKFEPGNFESKKQLTVLYNREPCLYEAVGRKEYVVVGAAERRIRLVHKDQATLDEIIFHELLHLKHFLEEKVGTSTIPGGRLTAEATSRNLNEFSLMKYSGAMLTDKTNLKPQEQALFPECQHKRVEPLWRSFEERRTVCGPDPDGITENEYRRQKGRPLRYIYQGADEIFFDLSITQNAVFGASFAETNFFAGIAITPGKEYVVWYSPNDIEAIYDRSGRLKDSELVLVAEGGGREVDATATSPGLSSPSSSSSSSSSSTSTSSAPACEHNYVYQTSSSTTSSAASVKICTKCGAYEN